MMRRLLITLPALLLGWLFVTQGSLALGSSPVEARHFAYTYDVPAYTYDALAELSPTRAKVVSAENQIGPKAVSLMGRARVRVSGVAAETAEEASILPQQLHHFATNKNSVYTPQMQGIADRYGLDLDGSWNKELMAHLGRHPNAYHEFVLDGMRTAAREAGTDLAKFLELFEQYVKQPVMDNPELLRRSGWEQ